MKKPPEGGLLKSLLTPALYSFCAVLTLPRFQYSVIATFALNHFTSGHPSHPRDLAAHACMSYAYRARSQVWRFTHDNGSEQDVAPRGPLRVTNSDALVAPLLAGVAIAELPEFIAAEYLADGRLQHILPEWRMTQGGLYFVTPSARARPRKVQALSDFFAEHLSSPAWR